VSDNGRILVVDDDDSVRTVFSTKLANEGYVVETAENGRQAIEMSTRQFYELALIDIKLPDMEGTKLLTAMKEATPKMRKIIVTGHAELQNAIKAVNDGADGYLTKPVDLNILVAKVKEQLKKRRDEVEYGQEKMLGHIESRLRENPI
jgi:DNA-binding NtrC family response regulator